ncbi:MAG: glycosyltransferase family 4 protein [Clostridia bacterium]|nr:glycosyltransferase family 4 protein [Clostridia bacterium]
MLGVMVEPGRHNDGWKVPLRRLKHKALAWRWRRRVDMVLAAGELGRQWWCNAGFHPAQVVTFGYFVEIPDSGALGLVTGDREDTSVFRVIYVGSVNHPKALDLVLEALADIDGDWMLDIIGSGPLEEVCRSFVAAHGMSAKVHWHGNRPNDEVIRRIAASDLLVLPSRYDGWGAVVNEALAVGTPVLVSSTCGAKDLVVTDLQGEVFPSESVHGLRTALRRRMALGPVKCEQRERIRAWAAEAISPGAVAEYLIEVIRRAKSHQLAKVTPPWLLKV